MKKFFAKLLAVILSSLIIWSIVFNFIKMKALPYDYPMWVYKFELTQPQVKANQIIILGDSMAQAAIDPTKIEDSAINLGLSGASLIEMYLLFKRYMDNNKSPKKLILSLSPQRFVKENTFIHHALGFNLFSIKEHTSVIANQELSPYFYNVGYTLPIFMKDLMISAQAHKFLYFIDIIVNKLGIAQNQLSHLHNAFDSQNLIDNKKLLSKIEKTKGQYFFSDKEDNSIPDKGIKKEFKVDKLMNFYFEKILKLAHEKNIQVYLISPPINDIYKTYFNEDYIQKYYRYITDIKSRHPKVIISSKLSFYDTNLFSDPNHVSQKGMNLYTNTVVKFLNDGDKR